MYCQWTFGGYCELVAVIGERYCDLHKCANTFVDGMSCSRRRSHTGYHMTLEGMALMLPLDDA